MKIKSLISVLLSILVIFLSSSIAQATEYREVKAEEIIKLIENGKDINLTNCRIVGELNVSSIKLKKVPNPVYNELLNEGYSKEDPILDGINENASTVESSIKIENSIFGNDLKLPGTIFNASVEFSGTTFNDSADFSYTTFNDKANFSGTTFNAPTNFDGLFLIGYGNFSDSTFNAPTNFMGMFFHYGNFSNSTFNAPTNFERSNFDYVNFFDSTFNAPTNFMGMFFHYGNFSNSIFNAPTNFEGSNFDYVNFFDSTFNAPTNFRSAFYCVNFSDSTFNAPADFSRSSYNAIVDGTREMIANSIKGIDYSYPKLFDSLLDERYSRGDFKFPVTTFNDSVEFQLIDFNDSSEFPLITFNDSADFSGTTFNDSADFPGTTFNAPIHFSRIVFNNFTDFTQSTFNDSADFDSTYFRGHAHFCNAYFLAPVVFHGSFFYNGVCFTQSTFNAPADFSDSDFSNSNNSDPIWFDESNFNDSVDFNGSTFNDSPNFKLPEEFKKITTDDVKTCNLFRIYYINKALFEDSDKIYYDYRENVRNNKEISFSKLMDSISWVTCGYGTNLYLTLYSVAVLITFFAFVYMNPRVYLVKSKKNVTLPKVVCRKPGIYRSSDETNKSQSGVSLIKCFVECLFFSISTFTRLGSANWRHRDNFWYVVTIEGLLGWIMLGIFMATLTHLLIR